MPTFMGHDVSQSLYDQGAAAKKSGNFNALERILEQAGFTGADLQSAMQALSGGQLNGFMGRAVNSSLYNQGLAARQSGNRDAYYDALAQAGFSKDEIAQALQKGGFGADASYAQSAQGVPYTAVNQSGIPAITAGTAVGGSASAGSASAPGPAAGTGLHADWNPGTAQEMAASLGLDWQDMMSGLTAQEYLAGQDPSYKFQQEEAAKAIQASAAARGQVLGGGTLKALQNRAAQVASLDFQNAYARDLANRQLQLGQVTDAFGRSLSTHGMSLQELANYRDFDLGGRGLSTQASIANAGNQTQASIASANNATQASVANANYATQASIQNAQLRAQMAMQDASMANQMTQSQWNREIQQRGLNLQERNDIFNRGLSAFSADLAANNQAFNQNMAALGFATGLMGQNQQNAQAGVNFGYNMDAANRNYLAGLGGAGLGNLWENRNNQQTLLGGLVNAGQNSSNMLSQLYGNQAGALLGQAGQYGNAGAIGALGSGQAWSNAFQGINNAAQGAFGNYLLGQILTGQNSKSGPMPVKDIYNPPL